MMTCKNIDNGRRGVALVVVLGMLAVLMLMAVAFSIHMRIERTGASNYRYGVQARHMAWAAVANAAKDIDGLMTKGGEPQLYPDWEIKGSTGTAESVAIFTKPAAVLTRKSAEYIPGDEMDPASLRVNQKNSLTG